VITYSQQRAHPFFAQERNHRGLLKIPKTKSQFDPRISFVLLQAPRRRPSRFATNPMDQFAEELDVEYQTVQIPDNKVTENVAEFKSSYHDPNGPHYVGVNLMVHFVSNINTVLQQFDIGMYLNFEYKPSKKDVEEYNKLKEKGDEKDFTPEYQPAFRLPNMMGTTQREMKPYLDGSTYTLLTAGENDTRGAMVKLPNGWKYMIAGRMAIRGTFAEPFELKNFPVDCQDLRVVISSTATTHKQVIVPHFRRDPFVTIDQEYTGLPEWTRHPPICDFVLSDKEKSARKYQFSSMILLIKVSRKSASHILRTASLIFCITVSQLSVFAMEPNLEGLGDRLSIGFTLVLTSLVFMFVVEARLPKVPYLTLLDKYIYGSFYLMVLIMVGSTLVLRVKNDEQRRQWNTKAMLIAACSLVVFQVWFICSILYYGNKEHKKLTMSSIDNAKQNESLPQLRINSGKLYKFEHSFLGSSLDNDNDNDNDKKVV